MDHYGDKNFCSTEMTMPDNVPGCLKHASGWQLLNEFLISGTIVADDQMMEQLESLLRNLGLGPEKVQRIHALVDQSIVGLQGIYAPLHIRLSVSDDIFARLPEAGIENRPIDLGQRCCLGFFVVKRIVGQLPSSELKSYRLVEVMIYGE
jgi:hypothetical protein